MPKIIRLIDTVKFGRTVIFCLTVVMQVGTISAQEINFFGIPEFGSRSIGMGFTGVIDAYGPLSVLRNPALNRTGKRVTIKPFFQWTGNGNWDEVTLIPQQINGSSGRISPDSVSTGTGLTSNYLGGVIQGRGFTLGYIHSNRNEFLFFRDVGLIDPPTKFSGRHVESDLLFAGYNIKFGKRARLGFIFKNFQFRDTGVMDTLSASIVNRDDVDLFLDKKGSINETVVGIDIGGLLALSVFKRPLTIGFSLINVVSGEFKKTPVPLYLNAGVAVVPIRNLVIEFNAVDIMDEDGMFGETGKRVGFEYAMRGLRIRSGYYGDNLSFGLGVGGEGLTIDYGVIELDHNDVLDRDKKENFQSLQISLSGNFY